MGTSVYGSEKKNNNDSPHPGAAVRLRAVTVQDVDATDLDSQTTGGGSCGEKTREGREASGLYRSAWCGWVEVALGFI